MSVSKAEIYWEVLKNTECGKSQHVFKNENPICGQLLFFIVSS